MSAAPDPGAPAVVGRDLDLDFLVDLVCFRGFGKSAAPQAIEAKRPTGGSRPLRPPPWPLPSGTAGDVAVELLFVEAVVLGLGVVV